jgi:hypothetical protein
VQTVLMNVRFEENNGHDADVTGWLLLTQSGHLPTAQSARFRVMGLRVMCAALSAAARHLGLES